MAEVHNIKSLWLKKISFLVTVGVFMGACGSVSQSSHDGQTESETQTAPAGLAGGAGVTFDVHIDINHLITFIDQKVSSNQNRPGFVRSLAETVFFAADQKLNVMVFNMNQEYARDLAGVKFYSTVNYDGIPFGVWAFESGTFTNKGDAGSINWWMIGNHDKVSGDSLYHVTFLPLE